LSRFRFFQAAVSAAGRGQTSPGRRPGAGVRQDEADPGHVVLTEVYRDEQASAAHKQTPHYAAWRDAVAEMMAEPRQSTRFAAVFPADDPGWVNATP
jgi:(4S)-4-hydroxy-5-phosphonooxypentane-2,3-dione isomerase